MDKRDSTTADTSLWKFLQVWPGPFRNLWVGLEEEATIYVNDHNKQIENLEFENKKKLNITG